MRYFASLCLIVLSTTTISPVVRAHVTECDWVAGHTTEPERQAPGVPPQMVNWRGAYQYDWYDGLLVDDLEELLEGRSSEETPQ